MENDNTKNQGVELNYHGLPENEYLAFEARKKLALINSFDCHPKSFELVKGARELLEKIEHTRNPAPSRMPENEANKNVGDLVEMLEHSPPATPYIDALIARILIRILARLEEK